MDKLMVYVIPAALINRGHDNEFAGVIAVDELKRVIEEIEAEWNDPTMLDSESAPARDVLEELKRRLG